MIEQRLRVEYVEIVWSPLPVYIMLNRVAPLVAKERKNP